MISGRRKRQVISPFRDVLDKLLIKTFSQINQTELVFVQNVPGQKYRFHIHLKMYNFRKCMHYCHKIMTREQVAPHDFVFKKI